MAMMENKKKKEKKGVFGRILDAVGLEEETYEEEELMEEEDSFYEDEYIEDEEPEQRFQKRKQGKIAVLPSTSNKVKMLVFQPSSYEEAESIIDNLKVRKPVIMNLDDLEIELGQRILDFVGGAVYSMNGDIKKVARSIFVVAPSNVDVSQNIPERGGRDGRRFD
jgi:cell division inhibitor SepF